MQIVCPKKLYLSRISMENIRITLVQCPLVWENPEANLAHLDSLLSPEKTGNSHLVVLPEMFTTGFTMKPGKNAEKHPGQGLAWMQKKSKQLKSCLTGSICVEENGQYFNRLYFSDPEGNHQSYNKRHLFRMGDEHNHYAQSNDALITEVKGWKIKPLVCYDLRFPVWARNKWSADGQTAAYDVLVYVANWPEVRNHAWKSLLVARAIENQCYVIGVNRIGADGNLMMHSGDSVVIDPLGATISKTQAHKESVETVELDMEFLKGLRKKFPVGMDSDNFELK